MPSMDVSRTARRGNKRGRIYIPAILTVGLIRSLSLSPAVSGQRKYAPFHGAYFVRHYSSKHWKILDLFDNPVGYLTVLQFFRLKALQNCVF
jgi:hypothetical protein